MSDFSALPWPTADDDPVDEQIVNDIALALTGVMTTSAAGVSAKLAVKRATTATGSIGTDDLETLVWFDDPEPAPAPYGQSGWKAVFEVCVYVREDAAGLPIDRRLALVKADVHAALLADPRRGGRLVVDCSFTKILFLDGGESGVSSVRSYLTCEYRTVRGNPRQLAPAAGNELLYQAGATLLFAPAAGGKQVRLADLRVTPLIEPRTEEATDDTNGLGRVADEVVTGVRTRYEVEGENLSPQMLAWQLGGSAVGLYGRAAIPLVNLPVVVGGPDSIVMLVDVQGHPLVPVASVQSVTSPTANNPTVYVAGTDYLVDADCLAEGFIKIPAGSTIPAGMALVNLTPAAVAGRPTFDVAAGCGFRGVARIVWQDATGRTIVHGDFPASIVAQSATTEPGRPAVTKLTLTVLDGGQATAGRVLYPAGSVPAAGY